MGIAAMNASFKFNRSQLRSKKKDKFAHKPGKYPGSTKKDKYDHVVLKPEVLKEIRERLQKERKLLLKRRMIIFFITLVLLLGLVFFN
jgi:hypothetical protein